MNDNQDKHQDSAGVPWAGRSFQENNYRDDSGEADPELSGELIAFLEEPKNLNRVMAAFGSARVLIPLVANLGEEGIASTGLKFDKSAELAIVTVLAPDGQRALPVFSSVSKMRNWNPLARPVPNNGRAVALAAASEGTTRVVLDPGSDSEIVFRRPHIEAIAQDLDWQWPHANPEVENLISDFLRSHPFVDSCSLTAGDPRSMLQGQELVITLYLESGLSSEKLQEFERTFLKQLGDSDRFVNLVDSVAVRFLPAS